MHAPIISILVLSTSLAVTVTRPVEEFRCTYERKVECDNGQCTASPIGSAYLLVPSLDSLLVGTMAMELDRAKPPQIRRCDDRSCSAVDVTAKPSGMFVNVSSLSGGYYLKVVQFSLDQVKKGMFVESASTFLTTVTYWGSCQLR